MNLEKRYTHINTGNEFNIVVVGMNGIEYLWDGSTPYGLESPLIKDQPITIVSVSEYIEIVNNVPQWKADISEELLNDLNESIKQKRAIRYNSECDAINAEINRRDLIGDLTTDEKQVLIDELTTKSQAIKDELPYYTEVVLT